MITSSFIPILIIFVIPSIAFGIIGVKYDLAKRLSLPGFLALIFGYWIFFIPFALVIDWISSEEIEVRYSLATLVSIVAPFFYSKFVEFLVVDKQKTLTENESASYSGKKIKVLLTSETRSEPVGKKEVIQVPQGVSVSVKRSISIEHQVSINSSEVLASSFDIGFREILMASIKSNIEQSSGESTKQTEMIEYEIKLDGSVSNNYSLMWKEIWRKGLAMIETDGVSEEIGFEFLESAELVVLPQ